MPSIVKYSQSERLGIRPQVFDRYAIGYVLRGRKYIYSGSTALPVSGGEMFYLDAGHHYTEEIPDGDRPFEQLVFYFTPDQMGRTLSMLSGGLGMEIEGHEVCDNCRGRRYIVYPAWRQARGFFLSLNQYLRDGGGLTGGEAVESLKMLELVSLIVANRDCCLLNRLLDHSDQLTGSFEQIVHANIFSSISTEELAALTNRSLTSFKKEFRRRFFESPHQWVIRQRLMHARMQLISTSKPIAEIGAECMFPNTSHFIKLFKKEYGYTPSVYRNRHLGRMTKKMRETEQG
jgi:AraC-like DNA-binding protein